MCGGGLNVHLFMYHKFLRNGLLISLFCIAYPASGQELFRMPAAFQAVGNASVSLESSLAGFSNPAGAATAGLAAGLLYDNRFLLKDLSTRSAFLVMPVQDNRILFSFSQFGSDGYRENKFSVGLARQLSPVISAGIQFHYFNLFLAENDRRPGNLLTDIGLQLRLSGFGLGVQYFNPYALSIREETLTIEYPSFVRVGAHKTFEGTFWVTAELYGGQSGVVEPRMGMQYLLKNQLALRCGVETCPGIFSLGLGYLSKRVCSDLTFSYHPCLGLSPSFTIYFQHL